MLEQPKIGIKIEGPSDEKVPALITAFMLLAVICVAVTVLMLLFEFLNIQVPFLMIL